MRSFIFANAINRVSADQQDRGVVASVVGNDVLCAGGPAYLRLYLERSETAGSSERSQRRPSLRLVRGANGDMGKPSLWPVLPPLKRPVSGLIAAFAAACSPMQSAFRSRLGMRTAATTPVFSLA